MKNTPLIATALLATLSVQGCATKELGRQGSLSSYEREAMTCKDIQQEMAKVVSFVENVNKPAEHKWYDLSAVMEERWIGNTQEKSAALDSANTRMIQLWTLHDGKKCIEGAALQPLGLPVHKSEVEERPVAPAPVTNTAASPAKTPAAAPATTPAATPTATPASASIPPAPATTAATN